MGVRTWIREQWPIPYLPASLRTSYSALRGLFSEAFYGVPSLQQHTSVNYVLARSLYRNDNADYRLGSGFVRPLIDLTVEYVGIPEIKAKDAATTVWLNECMTNHWAPQFAELLRDSIRDSKTVFRYRQPAITNPLFTEEDRMHGRIDVLPPEIVELSFDPADADLVDQAVIHHEINMDMRTELEIRQGVLPKYKVHHVLEIITKSKYVFYDKTDNVELTEWGGNNPFGFVPVWIGYNEYAADLGGGQSDIEPILPFIQAFHDVLLQTLGAHRYHSTPKAKFTLNNMFTFLENNFPEVIDQETKRVKEGAKINWSGREIMFFSKDEDAEFLEARSVLGDSKTLLEFLIECIVIAGEVPKWAIMKDIGARNIDASIEPFSKKIERKRTMFAPLVQMICKMALAAKSASPETVQVHWPEIQLSDLASKAQSVQQIVMALDTAKLNRWVSDDTCIQILRSLFEQISDPETEKAAAAKNYEPPVVSQASAPASPSQGNQSANGNGGGSKSTATKAVKKLTTTKASNS